jgi:hypothetical protein
MELFACGAAALQEYQYCGVFPAAISAFAADRFARTGAARTPFEF